MLVKINKLELSQDWRYAFILIKQAQLNIYFAELFSLIILVTSPILIRRLINKGI